MRRLHRLSLVRTAAIPASIIIVALLIFVPVAQAYEYEPDELEFLYILNDHRQSLGLVPVQLSWRLSTASKSYSQLMAQTGCFSHTCSGTTLSGRVGATGYPIVNVMLLENIAWSTDPSPQAVFDAWYASSGHRVHMEDPYTRAIGIGRAYDPNTERYYWTTDFGSQTVTDVQPHRDVTPPTVSFAYLADGSMVSGLENLTASASDDTGVTQVDFYIDGQPVDSKLAPPYTHEWNASGLSGSHTLGLVAHDAAGYTGSSAITVTVNNFIPTRKYMFTWYDQSNGYWQDWVLMANPAGGAGTARTSVQVGKYTYADTSITVGSPAQTPQFPGLMGGPVTVATTQQLITSQRVLFKNSFEEVLGIDENKLSNHFWWPWYDMKSTGFSNWILVANPSATNETVRAVISFTSQPDGAPITAESDIPAGQNWNPVFSLMKGGPVEVKAYLAGAGHSWDTPADRRNVIASQRVLSNNGAAFNEVPGIPAGELSSDYLWAWYDSVGAQSNSILVGNPYEANGLWYSVKIGTTDYGCQGPVAQNQVDWWSHAGLQTGPVELRTYSDSGCTNAANSVASQRIIWGPSFEEVPGYPQSALNSAYTWTWYDDKYGMNWVLVGNPSSSETVTAEITFTDRDSGLPVTGSYDIGPGENVFPRFTGKMGGPVDVSAHLKDSPDSSRPIIASQRALWNGYFNEVLGTVLD